MKNVEFKIYQMKHDESTHGKKFFDLPQGENPERELYNEVYHAGIKEKDEATTYQMLENLFYIFNMQHPENFRGHSLSVSDIIELDGKLYVVQRLGFRLVNWEGVE